MIKYRVKLERTLVESLEVDVEADSEDLAEAEAKIVAEEGPADGVSLWITAEIVNEEVETIEVTELEEEDEPQD